MKHCLVSARRRGSAIQIFIGVISLLVPCCLHAQAYPRLETYMSFALAHSDFGDSTINSPGVQFSGGYNLHRFIRLTGEFSGTFHGTKIAFNDKEMRLRDYHLLVGPEFVFRNRSKITPYVHVLAGYGTRHYNVGSGVYYCTGPYFSCSEKENTIVAEKGLAMAFGGGVDVAVHPMISIRALQFDYVRTHLGRGPTPWMSDPAQLPPLNSWQKNFRFGFGVVFKLGQRGTS